MIGRSNRPGRDGSGPVMDELSRSLLLFSLVPITASLFTRKVARGNLSIVLYVAAMIVAVWAVWRMFSRNKAARANENRFYTGTSFYRNLRDASVRFSQRRDYRFYRCPGCRDWLRVPRGKGTLDISCPKCGSRFRRRT